MRVIMFFLLRQGVITYGQYAAWYLKRESKKRGINLTVNKVTDNEVEISINSIGEIYERSGR